MPKTPEIKSLYEYQSGGYPMDQVLIIEGGDDGQKVPLVCAFFADDEMDVFMVEFGHDGEIVFHTADVTHIATNPSQLDLIASLAEQAIALREELDTFMDDDSGWSGHEHLITRPNSK